MKVVDRATGGEAGADAHAVPMSACPSSNSHSMP